MYYNKKLLIIQLINYGLMILCGIICVLTNVSYNRSISIMIAFLGLQQLIWSYNYNKLKRKGRLIIGLICSISLFICSILVLIFFK